MQTIQTILQKTLVNEFYKINAGFFLFLFFILFGIPADLLHFHLSLMDGITESPVFLAAIMAVWLLYNLKCINYLVIRLKQPQQQFFFCLNSLPRRNVFCWMLFSHVMVFLPVLLYAGLLAFVAAENGRYIALIGLILFNLATVIFTAMLLLAVIERKPQKLPFFSLPVWNVSLPKPLAIIPLWYLWYNRKQMLLVTKVFSLLVLYGFFTLYEISNYDIRPLQLCLMFCAATHCATVFQLHEFGETALAFSRNLPLSTSKRFMYLTAMYGALLLPELILIWKGYPAFFSFLDYLHIAVMPVGLLCFFHSVLLVKHTNTDGYLRIVFFVCMVLLFIILYSPGLWLSLSLMLPAFIIYRAHLYRFEIKK